MDGYVRVSRVGAREGPSYISPSVQREQIERWATYKNVQIIEWHIDEDQSGGAASRPGLDAAIERAITGQTNGIVSARIDRFSRLTEQGLRDLRRLNEAGARLAFVAEDIDASGPMGRMVYTLMLSQAEYFLETIKAGWDIAKRRAVDRGAYISRTPFGYRRLEDGALEPHPEQATVVTEAFQLAAANSIHAAIDYLKLHAPDRTWTTTTVRRMLAGRSYLGETRNGDLVKLGTHQALVTRAIWEAAQSSPSQRKPNASFPLSGLLECGTCGARMVGGRGGKGQRTYRYSATMTTGRGTCERGAVITAELIEGHVRDWLQAASEGIVATVSVPEGDTVALLERELFDAEAELDAFAADLQMRRVLGDRYHAHLETRAKAVETARAALREQARHAAGEELLPLAEEIGEDMELTGRLLRRVCRAVVVEPGRGVSIDRRVRFDPHGD